MGSNSETRTCSCRTKSLCPLNEECLKSSIVYKATVNKRSGDVSYLGVSETPFKDRLYNHSKAFKHRQYEKDTELSKLVWQLKDAGEQFGISWQIAASAQTCKEGGGTYVTYARRRSS